MLVDVYSDSSEYMLWACVLEQVFQAIIYVVIVNLNWHYSELS